MSWTDTFMVNCRQASFLNEKKKEGALNMSERFGLWLHLVYCSLCRLFFRQMEQLEQAAKNLKDKDIPLDPTVKVNMEKSFEAELKR